MRSKAKFITLLAGLALCFVFYHGLVFSSAVKTTKELKLTLPVNDDHGLSVMKPQVYLVNEPGEFHDVDLPDDIKAKKYPDFITTDPVDQKTTDHHNAAVSLAVKQQKFSIQVAMFKYLENAQRLKNQLVGQYDPVFIISRKNLENQSRYDVRIGHYRTRQQAESALLKYNVDFNTQAFLISELL
ncbi:MAG: SPOR domain-containing protein [Gammaproteobacteria bacterium]|nr:SPOR domain-containing protein [Gammaproteobacteria bacterium]